MLPLMTIYGGKYIALSCKKKGDIDSIHFHKITGQFTYENKSILNRLVLNACAKKMILNYSYVQRILFPI